MPDCDNPVTDTGLKNAIPWADPAQACPVGIPDNTASVSFVNGLPVFSLGAGVGSVEGGGDNCPPVPPPAVSFVTTAENLGDGEGIFSGLVGSILQFFSLKVGSGLTLTNTGSSLLIELIDSGVVSWDDILSKPAEFPPSAHTHTLADITDAGSAAGADSGDFDPAGAAAAAEAAANAYTDLLAAMLGAMAFEADDPNDGQEYVRKNNAWAVVTPSGGDVATDSIWDAAGDMVIGTGANTAARVAIGANGYVWTSNGTTASWQPAGGGDGVGGILYLFNNYH